MANNVGKLELGKAQKLLLLLVSLTLSLLVVAVRIGLDSTQSLDQLARRSLAPEVALSNQKPTIFEFYADWCEVCQEMAPTMFDLEKEMENKIDIVLLNVDNERWSSYIDKYQVNGVPQFNFFNKSGELKGQAIGYQNYEKLVGFSLGLFEDNELVNINTFDNKKFSQFSNKHNPKVVSPRSHS